MRHLKAVDPSGAQTCPALLPDDLVQKKKKYTYAPRRLSNKIKTSKVTTGKELTSMFASLSFKHCLSTDESFFHCFALGDASPLPRKHHHPLTTPEQRPWVINPRLRGSPPDFPPATESQALATSGPGGAPPTGDPLPQHTPKIRLSTHHGHAMRLLTRGRGYVLRRKTPPARKSLCGCPQLTPPRRRRGLWAPCDPARVTAAEPAPARRPRAARGGQQAPGAHCSPAAAPPPPAPTPTPGGPPPRPRPPNAAGPAPRHLQLAAAAGPPWRPCRVREAERPLPAAGGRNGSCAEAAGRHAGCGHGRAPTRRLRERP